MQTLRIGAQESTLHLLEPQFQLFLLSSVSENTDALKRDKGFRFRKNNTSTTILAFSACLFGSLTYPYIAT